MSKTIRFNAFEMNCVGHQSPGLHPRDRSWQYKDLDYWTDLARVLERGIFDAIFIADVIGYYDVYKGSNYHALHRADPGQRSAAARRADRDGDRASRHRHHRIDDVRAPVHVRTPAVDRRPSHEGPACVEHRHVLPRKRRENVGDNGLRTHDDRYAVAAEYVEVLYKLFEGSWEDGAVVRDRDGRVFTHPEKVHEIGHKGRFFDVPGYHLCEPSPQRTPVLFRPARPAPARRSPRSTRNACSSPRRRARSSRATWPTCARRPRLPGATRARS